MSIVRSYEQKDVVKVFHAVLPQNQLNKRLKALLGKSYRRKYKHEMYSKVPWELQASSVINKYLICLKSRNSRLILNLEVLLI